jgi:hypothetical protein
MKTFNKFYYILNYTWGIIPNLIAAIFIAPIFSAIFHKDLKTETCYGRWVFIGGANWGGLSMGNFIFMSKAAAKGTRTLRHEIGHSIQNALWGPAWLFVIGIPSFTRCCYRTTPAYLNHPEKHTDYDSIWFEGQATTWGTKYVEAYDASTTV